MKGAIIGDVIGSRYEFDRGPGIKDFGPLFDRSCCYTDDSATTMAVADAIMTVGKDATEEEFKLAFIVKFKEWAYMYPTFKSGGYGGRFYHWLFSNDTEPYGSYGNGSAMRVSPIGWAYDTLERTREVARWSAEVTHNHPEGVKGAESTAAAIFLLRNGWEFPELKEYIINEFHYDLSRSCDEIRPGFTHVEECQHTMPAAFAALFESDSFEDTIRTAVSLGGDCDTLTDITTAMAEAKYGCDMDVWRECETFIDERFKETVRRFEEFIK